MPRKGRAAGNLTALCEENVVRGAGAAPFSPRPTKARAYPPHDRPKRPRCHGTPLPRRVATDGRGRRRVPRACRSIGGQHGHADCASAAGGGDVRTTAPREARSGLGAVAPGPVGAFGPDAFTYPTSNLVRSRRGRPRILRRGAFETLNHPLARRATAARRRHYFAPCVARRAEPEARAPSKAKLDGLKVPSVV